MTELHRREPYAQKKISIHLDPPAYDTPIENKTGSSLGPQAKSPNNLSSPSSSTPLNKPPYREHAGEGSQYIRDFILGVNDGLISTLLLVFGIVGGGADSRTVLLAGISGAVAGAISMGLGEYMATKSQSEVTAGNLEIEKEHFLYYRDQELDQLRGFLQSCKLTGRLLDEVVDVIGKDDEALMKMMMAFEFGVQEDQVRSPLTAMWMSGRLFLLGSLPSVLPFLFTKDVTTDCIIAGCLCALALFVAGAWKTRTTKGNVWRAGFENLGAGALGAGVSYCIGLLYNLAA